MHIKNVNAKWLLEKFSSKSVWTTVFQITQNYGINIKDVFLQASNPGQFDNDVDVTWQKGQTPDSVYHVGRVGVNTEHPEEALTVHGNMRLTGHLLQPSDLRAKENLREVSYSQFLAMTN